MFQQHLLRYARCAHVAAPWNASLPLNMLWERIKTWQSKQLERLHVRRPAQELRTHENILSMWDTAHQQSLAQPVVVECAIGWRQTPANAQQLSALTQTLPQVTIRTSTMHRHTQQHRPLQQAPLLLRSRGHQGHRLKRWRLLDLKCEACLPQPVHQHHAHGRSRCEDAAPQAACCITLFGLAREAKPRFQHHSENRGGDAKFVRCVIVHGVLEWVLPCHPAGSLLHGCVMWHARQGQRLTQF